MTRFDEYILVWYDVTRMSVSVRQYVSFSPCAYYYPRIQYLIFLSLSSGVLILRLDHRDGAHSLDGTNQNGNFKVT